MPGIPPSFSNETIEALSRPPTLQKYSMKKAQLKLFYIVIFLLVGFAALNCFKKREKTTSALIHLKSPLDDFVGRNMILSELETGLLPKKDWNSHQSSRLTVLWGPGGVGKSELACYFANRHLDKFSLIFWIDSETVETRTRSYRQLANLLGIFPSSRASLDELTMDIFFKLGNSSLEKPWLLILDNVEESLPLPQRGGSILATSIRRDLWPSSASCVEVNPFSETEAVSYLKKTIRQDDTASMQALAKELGYFPLALGQAAAYITDAMIPIAEYLQAFREDRSLILSPLLKTWNLTLKRLKNDHPLAYEWLNIAAHLDPSQIPFQWIQDWSKSRKTSWDILRVLKNYSLIQCNTDSFSVHHLMHQVIYSQQKMETLNYYQKAFTLVNTNQTTDTWLSHATRIVKNGNLLSLIDRHQQKQLWDKIGDIKMWIGDVSGAKEAYVHAMEETEHLERATSLFKIGKAVFFLGEESLSYFEKSLEMRKALGASDSEIIDSLSYVGIGKFFKGRSQEALTDLFEALRMGKGTQKAFSHQCLGLVLDNLSRHQEALEHLQKALALYRSQKYHPEMIDTLLTLGNTFWSLEQPENALKYYQEGLEISKKIYGSISHPQTAGILINTGSLLKKMGRHREGKKYHQEALEFYQKWFILHPDEMFAHFNLGLAFYHLDKYEEALKYFQEALEISRKTPSDFSPLWNIADVLAKLGRYEEALSYFQENLDHFRNCFEGDRIIPMCLKDIGDVLVHLNRHQEAQEKYQEAQRLSIKISE